MELHTEPKVKKAGVKEGEAKGLLSSSGLRIKKEDEVYGPVCSINKAAGGGALGSAVITFFI